MNGGGRGKYSVPAAALSKHRRNATGICHCQPRHRARQPRHVEARNTPTGVSPLETKGISTSHVSASRPDLHGNRRLSGESLRQRHQGHRLAVQVGPRCGHDTWGTNSSTTGSRSRGTTAFNDGLPAASLPRATIDPVGVRSARCPACARSHTNRCTRPPLCPNAVSSDEVRQQTAKGRPLPLRVHPQRGWSFKTGSTG